MFELLFVLVAIVIIRLVVGYWYSGTGRSTASKDFRWSPATDPEKLADHRRAMRGSNRDRHSHHDITQYYEPPTAEQKRAHVRRAQADTVRYVRDDEDHLYRDVFSKPPRKADRPANDKRN